MLIQVGYKDMDDNMSGTAIIFLFFVFLVIF